MDDQPLIHFTLSPLAGRGPRTPCRVRGKRRRSRSEGEGARTDETPSVAPPHLRLPPRRAPRRGGDAAFSPAERGKGTHTSARVHRGNITP
ncbi:hypothetical protein FV218_18250 [Methylobacterium sp. WL69]|nr:hypothetical protein FV218_18250 [Methylobacterium sp. WL69]